MSMSTISCMFFLYFMSSKLTRGEGMHSQSHGSCSNPPGPKTWDRTSLAFPNGLHWAAGSFPGKRRAAHGTRRSRHSLPPTPLWSRHPAAPPLMMNRRKALPTPGGNPRWSPAAARHPAAQTARCPTRRRPTAASGRLGPAQPCPTLPGPRPIPPGPRPSSPAHTVLSVPPPRKRCGNLAAAAGKAVSRR